MDEPTEFDHQNPPSVDFIKQTGHSKEPPTSGPIISDGCALELEKADSKLSGPLILDPETAKEKRGLNPGPDISGILTQNLTDTNFRTDFRTGPANQGQARLRHPKSYFDLPEPPRDVKAPVGNNPPQPNTPTAKHARAIMPSIDTQTRDPHTLTDQVPNIRNGLSAEHQISLHITTATSPQLCRFWLGLATAGSISPSSLLDEKEVNKMFEEVTKKGISEASPLMLTDASQAPPRFIYFTPPPDGHQTDLEWMNTVLDSIASWEPQELGIYLPQEALGERDPMTLLKSLLLHAAKSLEINKFYLHSGSHGMIPVLNTALAARSDLQALGFGVKLYH